MLKKMLVIVIGLVVSGLFMMPVSAANRKQCKELKKDRCQEREDCQWVEAKKPYCRAKPKAK